MSEANTGKCQGFGFSHRPYPSAEQLMVMQGNSYKPGVYEQPPQQSTWIKFRDKDQGSDIYVRPSAILSVVELPQSTAQEPLTRIDTIRFAFRVAETAWAVIDRIG